MTKTDNKADGNSTTGKLRPKQFPALKADLHHSDFKHDEPLGRVGIAPAKPL